MTWKVLALVMLALPPHAGEQVRFYAPDGRSIGTAAPLAGGSTRYFDSAGRSTGTSSTTAGGFTTFYDCVAMLSVARSRNHGIKEWRSDLRSCAWCCLK